MKLKDPKFAYQLRIGDKVNGHCDGWLTVKKVIRHKLTSFQNIQVFFEDGRSQIYNENDEVDAIRLWNR